MQSLCTFRSALAVLGASWFAACAFPTYVISDIEDDPRASVCTDGLPSDAESGIDCGGGCPPCPMGEACRSHQDCESLSCANGKCQMASCNDGVKNGAEADRDCGGQCKACPPGRDCREAADCAEGVCADAFCQVPTCDDEVRNGKETDRDCGGVDCSPCDLGRNCKLDTDCTTGHCVGSVCVAPACTDGEQGDDETDVDCGGPNCGPCEAGEMCGSDDDCVSEICHEGLCTAYSCDDGVLNGDETALDCGGESCDGCGTLERCDQGSDCASGVCQSSRCVPASPTGEALSRDGWRASASDSYPDDNPNQVLDDIPGRWTSGIRQYDGMSFEVDMGQLQAFFSVELTCQEAAEDFPGRFDLYVSVDGNYGPPVKPDEFGSPITEVSFDTAQVARYVKFVIRQPKNKWLSIDEINVRR